jgi:hypothetical protein
MKTLSSRPGSALLALLVAGAATTVACAKDEKPEWSCSSADVPLGEVLNCTSSAMTYDGPPPGTDTTTSYGDEETCEGADDNPELCPPDGTSDGASDGSGTTYECPGAPAEDCPPDDASDDSSGSGSGDGSSTGGGGTSDGPVGSDGSGASSSGDGSTGPGNSGGNGNGKGRRQTECRYVPDLEYCSPNGSGGGTSDGSSTDDDCAKRGNCDAPGHNKGDGTSSSGGDGSGDGTSSGGSGDGSGSDGSGTSDGAGTSSGGESSSSGSSGKGKGKHWKCTKDKKGNKSCTSVPDCVEGTKPSACGACVPEGETADCVPPAEGGCWVTGGGFIIGDSIVPAAPADGHDNFGGNAKTLRDGRMQGHWNHVDHGTGNHSKGKPEYLFCRKVDGPGPSQPGGKKGFEMNQVYFGGPAEWRSNGEWGTGYWFDVVAKDHGEPGNKPHPTKGGAPDAYHFTIRKMDDPQRQVSGPVVYETRGDLVGGNIQLHPPNPGRGPNSSTLPSWVSLEP